MRRGHQAHSHSNREAGRKWREREGGRSEHVGGLEVLDWKFLGRYFVYYWDQEGSWVL